MCACARVCVCEGDCAVVTLMVSKARYPLAVRQCFFGTGHMYGSWGQAAVPTGPSHGPYVRLVGTGL